MTKIKNFRIQLRAREIARLLKARAWSPRRPGLQITPALEASIEHAISEAKLRLQPAAVYTTMTRSTAEKATSLPLTDPAVAVSVVAITIGDGLEEEIASASARQDTMQQDVLKALREEALGQAVQFIMRLIESQAKEEECDMSAPRETTESTLLGSLGALLGTHRIGLALDKDASTLPPYARLVWAVWSPKVREKTRQAVGGRAEKAAVS